MGLVLVEGSNLGSRRVPTYIVISSSPALIGAVLAVHVGTFSPLDNTTLL